LLPFRSPDTKSGRPEPKSSISAAKEHYYGEDIEILAKRREKIVEGNQAAKTATKKTRITKQSKKKKKKKKQRAQEESDRKKEDEEGR
jgi:hypothetical protein